MTDLDRLVEAAKQSLLSDTDTDAWMDRDGDPADFKIDGNVNLVKMIGDVLAALRDPSEAMWSNGYKMVSDPHEWSQDHAKCEGVATWQAMIDTALVGPVFDADGEELSFHGCERAKIDAVSDAMWQALIDTQN